MAEELTSTEELDLSAEWQLVKELAESNEPEKWALAIIEAEKILREALALVSFGSSVSEQIKNARHLLSKLNELLAVRDLHRRIVGEIGFLPTPAETQKSLELYFQSILDLTSFDQPTVGFWRRSRAEFFLRFGRFGRFLRDIALGVIFFFAAVWFLAETNWGRRLTAFLIELTRWVIKHLGTAALFLLMAAVLLMLLFAALDRRRK